MAQVLRVTLPSGEIIIVNCSHERPGGDLQDLAVAKIERILRQTQVKVEKVMREAVQ